MLTRAVAAFGVAFALSSAAWAQDDAACGKFKWSVARERAWFAASPKPIETGGDAALGEGLDVTLVPNESVGYVVPPERPAKPGSFGAVLKVALPAAGLYDVTLSAEAWIDMIQNGVSVRSSDFSGAKGCPGVRKTVRFDLAAGPTLLQISNSDAPKIMLAAAPAP